MDKNISAELYVAVVANDTAAPKNSFINVIAGEEIIPADYYSQGEDSKICVHWDNICFVESKTDFDKADLLIFVANPKRLFAKSLVNKINEIYKLNSALVEKTIFIGTLDYAVSEDEKLKIIKSAKEHAIKCYQQKEPRFFFISSNDNAALEEIKSEIFYHRRKKFLELAFDNLPEIINSLNAAESVSFNQKLQALKNRYYDPEFRLAIIGNFSCGKSTFLNALIGQELLSTSVLPTTAIPTYIRWDKENFLKSGKRDARKYYNPVVEITSGGKNYAMTRAGRAQLEIECGIKLPANSGEMIDKLTTDDSLIGKVERVELHFLERKGFENFCLIDTPGINPGDSKKREHIVQTQNLLREEADAAIVLYTAKDAMSHDTREFLEQNAKHLMQGAIVVLTKMDLVPPNQYEKILKNTKQLVSKQFNQKNPQVYDISAQRTIEFFTSRSQCAEDEKWARNFNETITAVIGQLAARRSEIISRRIADLTLELADSISKIIADEDEKLSAERATLDKADVENLEKEFHTLNKEYEKNLNSGKKLRKEKTKTIVLKKFGERSDKILSRIESSQNASELKDALENYYPTILKDVDKKIMKTVNAEIIPQINELSQKYVEQVEECLKKYQRYLGVVETKNISVRGNIAANISNAPDIVIEDSFFDNNAALIASGIVAFLFAGPLALLGGYFLDKYRFNSKKSEAKSAVSKSLIEYSMKLIKACTSSLKRVENENLAWAKDLLQKYKANYKEAFDIKEREHKQRVSVVENRIAQNTANKNFIQMLKDGLS